MQLMISAILLLALGKNVQAHFVRLERDGEGPARAYFGEWIDDIREKTGGLLDRIKAPRAFLGTSSELLPVTRNAKAGRYVLEVTHFEEKGGGSDDEKFNRTRHISSLSFVQPDGILWTDKR